MKILLTLMLVILTSLPILAGEQTTPENVASAEQPPFNSAEFNALQKVLFGIFIAVNIPGFILGMPALTFVCYDLGLATEFCGEQGGREIRFIFGSSIVFYTVLLLTLLRHKLRYLIQRLLGRQPVLPSKKLTRKEILGTMLLFLCAVFLFRSLYILTLALIDLLTQELALEEFLEIAPGLLLFPTLFLLYYIFSLLFSLLLKHKFSKKT